MGYQNYLAYQTLLEVGTELVKEINSIEDDPMDDEVGKENKHATKQALNFALGIVYRKLDEVNPANKK